MSLSELDPRVRDGLRAWRLMGEVVLRTRYTDEEALRLYLQCSDRERVGWEDAPLAARANPTDPRQGAFDAWMAFHSGCGNFSLNDPTRPNVWANMTSDRERYAWELIARESVSPSRS